VAMACSALSQKRPVQQEATKGTHHR